MPLATTATSHPGPAAGTWDIFSRVIDNHGDLGVCWRLACDLAGHGAPVRLWVDDASALAWMAPSGHPGVQVAHFDAAALARPADVVVEAFGCDPPEAFVQRMVDLAAAGPAPVWINLEYLSAEAYVERSHGLLSPQRNGLRKWFFYPGFTERTGGLLREADLATRQAAFNRRAWLAAQGLQLQPCERVVSLFCYAHAPVPRLLQALADHPTLLLLTPGYAQALCPPGTPLPAGVRTHALPYLPQPQFDELLWACDLNFVRGEDSLVRALWAGRPAVWHIYPQDDGVHADKLHALLNRLQAAAAVPGLDALWQAWNGLQAQGLPWPAWPDTATWRTAAQAHRQHLALQTDLCLALIGFVADKKALPAG
jgi:uncharacterized repeat protein (TIGR03837 family)